MPKEKLHEILNLVKFSCVKLVKFDEFVEFFADCLQIYASNAFGVSIMLRNSRVWS